MEPTDKELEILQNLEFAILRVWRANQAMTDYTVMRAYDAAIAHYNALVRQHPPKTVNLSGLDVAVYEAVKDICEWRLGRTTKPERPKVAPLPAEELVACLKRLRKSVERWNRTGGRQGYLQFIGQFVP